VEALIFKMMRSLVLQMPRMPLVVMLADRLTRAKNC
jgi:hypothetical protein